MYRMSLRTLEVLESFHRRKFCQSCLQDLKEDGFNADPKDPKQLEELVEISSRLEAKALAAESIQYRYFMLFYLLGPSLLQNKGIHNRLFNRPTELASCEFLEELIAVNLQEES